MGRVTKLVKEALTPRLWVVKRYVIESYDIEAYNRLDAITRSYEKGDPFDVEIKKETAKLKRSV